MPPLRPLLLIDSSSVQEETEQPPEEQDEGLSNVDYIAIALALGLTVFIVVFMAVFLYRAKRRRKNEYYKRRWRVNVNGNVSTQQSNTRFGIWTSPLNKLFFSMSDSHDHATTYS